MLVEQIEGKWVDVFKDVFDLCRVAVGDEVVILSESQSRQVNVRLADLALLALGVGSLDAAEARLLDPLGVRKEDPAHA